MTGGRERMTGGRVRMTRGRVKKESRGDKNDPKQTILFLEEECKKFCQ